jgi:hypothetical protein
MKAIYYCCKASSYDFHNESHNWYFPEKDLVLRKSKGIHFKTCAEEKWDDLLLLKNGEALCEAKTIAAGKEPYFPGMTFSNIKELDLDNNLVNSLLEYFILSKNLQSKINQRYDKLFKDSLEKISEGDNIS